MIDLGFLALLHMILIEKIDLRQPLSLYNKYLPAIDMHPKS